METNPIITMDNREIFEHDLTHESRPVVQDLVGVLQEKQSLMAEAQEAAKKVAHFNSLLKNEQLLVEKLKPMLPEVKEVEEDEVATGIIGKESK